MTDRRRRLGRLLFLALIGGGIYGIGQIDFPSERELVWRLPSGPPLRAVDIQIWGPGGKVERREQRFYSGDNTPSEVAQKVRMAPGTYPVHVFLRREGSSSAESARQTLTIHKDDTVVVTEVKPADVAAR